MQPNLRIYADYFSIGLLLGLSSIEEVIVWADKLIEKENYLSDWTIELSTSENKHPQDIIHLLDLVPGTKDLDFSLRMAIAKLSKVYPNISPERGRFVQPKDSKLLSLLYFFVQKHEELSDDVRDKVFQLYWSLDDVDQGYIAWSIIDRDYEELLALGNSYKKWIE